MSRSSLKGLADLRKPHEWWPLARLNSRKIYYHMGPTNSGKTFEAMEKLKKAKSGVYCGPLRLLAGEVFEKLNAAGVPCSLVTGQESIKIPGAKHTACTIETADLESKYDCAIIDEIQMIADKERGSSWTNALLGLCADELHLTGDNRAKSLVSKISKDTCEKVSFQTYKRLSKLQVEEPINSLSELKAGDCIVAFSRKTCHLLKRYLEKHCKGSCSIIYGNLPPETRREQARKFNEREDSCYLVATDAVGMGLNFNINRIIFFELEKHDGRAVRELFPQEIRQIAGRAGRYKTPGKVTACSEHEVNLIKKALEQPETLQIPKGAIFPSFEQISTFANDYIEQAGNKTYSQILQEFAYLASLEGKYFLQNIEEACFISDHLKKFRLPLIDAYTFAHAPVRLGIPQCMASLKSFAKELMRYGEVKLKHEELSSNLSLERLESTYFVLELYLWLAKKYEMGVFTDSEEALFNMMQCTKLIQEKIDQMSLEELQERRKRRRRKF